MTTLEACMETCLMHAAGCSSWEQAGVQQDSSTLLQLHSITKPCCLLFETTNTACELLSGPTCMEAHQHGIWSTGGSGKPRHSISSFFVHSRAACCIGSGVEGFNRKRDRCMQPQELETDTLLAAGTCSSTVRSSCCDCYCMW